MSAFVGGAGFFSRMPILRNTPAPKISRYSSSSVSAFTQAHTVPANLPTSIQAIILAIWIQDTAGAYTMTFDGNAAAETIAATDTSVDSTPCAAAFRWPNPAAGSRNLVLTQGHLRSLVTCMWLFDRVHPTIRWDASYHLEASANATTVPVSLATSVPTYGIALAGAQGYDTGPGSIDSGWTNLGSGHTASGTPSVSLDLGYIAAQKALPAAGTAAPTITFAAPDGRGAIALAIRGA